MVDRTRKAKESKPTQGKRKRLSMHPLTLEEALRGAMQAGPMPDDRSNQPASKPDREVKRATKKRSAKP